MTAPATRTAPRLPHPANFIAGGLLLVTLAIPLLLVPSAAVAGSGLAVAWASGDASWTNGLVLCDFDNTAPAVTVSALSLPQSGLWATLSSVEEMGAGSAVVATASMASGTWVVANLSTDDAYDLAYTASVPIVGSDPSATPLGHVDVEVQFILPAYAGSGEGNLTQVSTEVSITNWSWQQAGDHLAMVMPMSPAYPESEHLSPAATGGPSVWSVSNATGQPLESMEMGTTAAVGPAGNPSAVVPVAPSFSMTPSEGSVTLVVGNSSGEYQGLNYSAVIGIVVPATVAGIPLYEYGVVGGVAAAVSLLAAGSLRRARRRQSDVIYVEDQE